MDKHAKRQLKQLGRHLPLAQVFGPIDCACVIHGTAYSWDYVDKLYNMLTRHIQREIHLHVYTESERSVPAPYIKHSLDDWNISGPKKSWWYKMQLFNSAHHAGPLLYFDLDVVVTRNIDWIWQCNLQNFWAVRDFKYLWRKTSYNINSSIMWWDTRMYAHVYQDFIKQDFSLILRKYHGDQDYINDHITQTQRRFFDTTRIASWRWEALDGGYDFDKRYYKQPGAGTVLSNQNSVLIFHGKPKPCQIQDQLIIDNWR